VEGNFPGNYWAESNVMNSQFEIGKDSLEAGRGGLGDNPASASDTAALDREFSPHRSNFVWRLLSDDCSCFSRICN
jgi:hypothetical protein